MRSLLTLIFSQVSRGARIGGLSMIGDCGDGAPNKYSTVTCSLPPKQVSAGKCTKETNVKDIHYKLTHLPE